MLGFHYNSCGLDWPLSGSQFKMQTTAKQFLLRFTLSVGACFVVSSALANEPQGQVPSLVDYYDGLRAWDLGQKQIAVGLWVTAANWGDSKSMQRLAELYEAGDTLPRDNGLACYWYTLAGKRGNGVVQQASDRYCASLSPTDFTTVRNAVAEWKSYTFDAANVKELEKALSEQEQKQTQRDLLLALNRNNLKGVQDALSDGVSGAVTLEDGTPVLFLAVATGNPDIVSALISHGANANSAMPDGRTPLHVAAVKGSQAVANALTSGGASAAIQDNNGVWPFEYASRKHFEALAIFLKSKRDADIAKAVGFLVAVGYLPEGALDNSSARDLAVRMYQNGRNGLSVTGALEVATLAAIEKDISYNRQLQFKFVIRYRKNQMNWVKDSKGAFPSVADARAAAMDLCKKESGTKCKFNFAPPGGCIALAEPDYGEYRVSRPLLTKKEALSDAIRQCREGTENCKESNVYCTDRG